jgi:cytochrome c peroxidase
MTRNSTLKLRRIIFALAFIFPAVGLTGGAASPSDKFEFKSPAGLSADLWAYYVPKDNPMIAAKVELGRKLFFDKRLSSDGTISCATCHDPDLAFADGKKVAEGVGGKRGVRNSPSLLNAMFNSGQFWDGRVESLEGQAVMPLVNPDEMGSQTHDQVVTRLKNIPEYASQFQEVFASPVTIDAIAKAIAAFERTLVSGNSPFDRFVSGERHALTEAAQRGLTIFRTKARCTVCHSLNQSFPFLTDNNYRNTGVASNYSGFPALMREAVKLARAGARQMIDALSRAEGGQELGRFIVTGNTLDVGAFRTPSLRNIELTAPYFHDGSAATLADVIRFYARGGNDNPGRDWELQQINIDENEINDLIEFLKSLTSEDLRRR